MVQSLSRYDHSFVCEMDFGQDGKTVKLLGICENQPVSVDRGDGDDVEPGLTRSKESVIW